jgi:SH3 domain protein
MAIISRTHIIRLCAVCLLAMASWASAQTIRYVSDEFQVPVREAPRKESRVVTLISSGTPVEVLQENVRGYSLIRAQGTEGWVRARDLMDIPSGRARLAEAEKRFEERRLALEEREQQIKDLQARLVALERHNRMLTQHNGKLGRELKVLQTRTAKPLATEAENRRLEEALVDERRTVRTLMDENDALKMQAIRDWFLIGAAVSLGSLLLGVIIARLPWRRQQQKW